MKGEKVHLNGDTVLKIVIWGGKVSCFVALLESHRKTKFPP